MRKGSSCDVVSSKRARNDEGSLVLAALRIVDTSEGASMSTDVLVVVPSKEDCARSVPNSQGWSSSNETGLRRLKASQVSIIF